MTGNRERLRELLYEKALAANEAPLSFAQQRLWFSEQLITNTALFNVPIAVHLDGELDRDALRFALRRVTSRHESLRATFHESDGRPVQIIAPDKDLALDIVEVASDQQVAELIRHLANQPFDLSRGPLIRATLAHLPGGGRHTLILVLHHIVTDGWSMGVLVNELTVLYAAHRRGDDTPLPPLNLQYLDFARWQRTWVDTADAQAQFDFWAKHLQGAPASLELPTDGARPVFRSGVGAKIPFALDLRLSKALKELCKVHGATPFMTILAAFGAFLARLSGQDDVVVGTPIANRNRQETEALIGVFVNTLPLRLRPTEHSSFNDLLVATRRTALDAYANQDYPFDKLVERLNIPRDPSRTPLFQAMFTLQNAPLEALRLDTVAVRVEEVTLETAQYDLSLTLLETESGFDGSFEYDSSIFTRDTVERWANYFSTLLTCAVEHPGTPVIELPLLSAAEQARIVGELSQERAFAAAESQATLHQAFEVQAMATPSAVAIVSSSEQLTYESLNRRANRLARRLRHAGVERGSAVAICLPAGVEDVLARLAVLKAGGAFVALDPANPPTRNIQLATLSGARLLLTEQSLWQGHAEGLQPMHIPPGWTGGDDESGENFTHDTTPRDLAYIAYTSGSTGIPKGVAITHEGIVHRMAWEQGRLPLTPADRVLQLANPSFDASTWEMFRAFFAGARLVIADGAHRADTGYLSSLIAQHAITVIGVVPSLLEALLEEPAFNEARTLRHVVCAGDRLRAELAARFCAHNDAVLYNFYGQTEVSIDALWWTCTRDQTTGVVPVGRPIDGMRVYVLDSRQRPVPPGIPGELYIGGPGVARGYIGDSADEQRAFVADPFRTSDTPLFRTGDRVRMRPDGVLEFIERIGRQVKLRGIRIELGEIEAALRTHPAVKDVVLVPRKGQGADMLPNLLDALEADVAASFMKD